MPSLLVVLGARDVRQFALKPGETIIGRDDGATLLLPDTSVSRRHARIVVDGAAAVVEDLQSQNGTLFEDQKIERRRLRSKDALRIGKFQVVFLGDSPDDRFYKGRFVRYLPTWDPFALPQGRVSTEEVSTAAFSVEALKAMRRDPAIEHGRVVLAGDATRFWYPEDRKLTFGRDAMIPVEGFFAWGTVAEVWWDGKRHRVRQIGTFTKVRVNGTETRLAPLKPGDDVQIGGTRFRYEIGDD
ncbi:MAG: FHA domain-containing protein [Myxococcota bacterium]